MSQATSVDEGIKASKTSLKAQRPRQVGICMKHLPVAPTARFNSQNVPWQRVINSRGIISPRSQPSGAQDQAAALRAEGVDVATGALGELVVDLAQYSWFPRRLPSEARQDRDEHQDST